MSAKGKGHGEKLSRQQEKAIAALLIHTTVAGAATSIGVSRQTLDRWLLDEPGFCEAYRKARQGLLRHTVGNLLAISAKATKTLSRNMTCGQASAEIAAAKAALELATKGTDVLDLQAKVAELESMIKELKGERNSDTKPN